MEIYISGRQCGKTTMLIKESARTGATIAVATYPMVYEIEKLAKHMSLNIPQPVTYAEIFKTYRNNKTKRYLVDELQMMLGQLNVDTATLGYEEDHSTRVYILDEHRRVTPLILKGG